MPKRRQYELKKSVLWFGAKYRRKDGTWRDASGRIFRNATDKRHIGFERPKHNMYGVDRKFQRVRSHKIRK